MARHSVLIISLYRTISSLSIPEHGNSGRFPTKPRLLPLIQDLSKPARLL